MGSGPILIVFTITETAEICKFSLSDFEFFFFVFFLIFKHCQFMLYRFSHFNLLNFEGKINLFGIMCFNWMSH